MSENLEGRVIRGAKNLGRRAVREGPKSGGGRTPPLPSPFQHASYSFALHQHVQKLLQNYHETNNFLMHAIIVIFIY